MEQERTYLEIQGKMEMQEIFDTLPRLCHLGRYIANELNQKPIEETMQLYLLYDGTLKIRTYMEAPDFDYRNCFYLILFGWDDVLELVSVMTEYISSNIEDYEEGHDKVTITLSAWI